MCQGQEGGAGIIFMKKFLISCLLACATLTGAYASKAITVPFQVTLQNGQTVMAQFHGDEHFHFYTTTSGELLIFENNTWRIATEADKAQMTKEQKAVAKRRKANERIKAVRPFPHTGTPKALVIMVDFSDQKFVYTKNDINKLLNGTEYDTSSGYHSYGSAAQYFNDCSNGKFRPQFDVVGPYHLNKSYRVYGVGKNDDMPSLIRDVCTIANKDVDFSKYDSDNDEYVDLVYIIYAGYSAQWGDDKAPADAIWPKSGAPTSGNYGTYDGKAIYRYGVNNELAFYPNATLKPYLAGIGVFLHEMSHTMGLPDLYPTVTWEDITKYDNQSMEEWDLMDGGENTYYGFSPAPYTAWERELLGWTDKMETLTIAKNVTLTPLSKGGKGLRVMNDNDASGNEYYILESIDKSNGWYKRMPGDGMLVTHVNYDVNEFSNFNGPNNTPDSARITVLPANGIIYSSYHYQNNVDAQYAMTQDEVKENWKGNTYPGTQNVTSLTNWKPYKGTMSKDITNIVQKSNGDVTFAFMGGIPVLSFAKTEMTCDGKSAITNTLNIQYPRSDGKTTYKSSNTAIATVDANGKVTGVDDGTATITATYTYSGGTKTATYKVTVKFPVPTLAFAKSEIKTDAKSTVTNALNITNGYTDGKTTYKSSNTAVATVDANGNVKGVANGTATITATYTYRGGKKTVTATYKVTVAIPTITLASSTIKMDGKTTATNKVSIKDEWTDGKLSYKSSNTNVATIDNKGVITAKNNGTTTITVTYTYNNGKKVVYEIDGLSPRPPP